MKLNFVKASPVQNTTILITDHCPRGLYIESANTAASYEYAHAEQVGFIVPPKSPDSVLRLEMAGDEFCGNATLSAAAYVKYKGMFPGEEFFIETSGVDLPIKCQVKAKSDFLYTAKCEVPLCGVIEKLCVSVNGRIFSGSIVNFAGISHFITESRLDAEMYDEILAEIIKHVHSGAIGIIPYRETDDGNFEIKPYVYVKQTNTRVFERGCGSGSLALGHYLKAKAVCGAHKIYQPGGVITVEVGEKSVISVDVKFTCQGFMNI